MLTLWNPLNDFDTISRRFDRLFAAPLQRRERSFAPAVDVEEHEDHYTIVADLPGHDEANIDVQVHDGTLVLSGKRELTTDDPTHTGVYRERTFGTFCRTFRLGALVDAETIEASYDKGVLTVTLPKKEQAKPRQIPIKGDSSAEVTEA